MAMKSKVFAVHSLLSLPVFLMATASCGNAPSESGVGTVSEADSFLIGFQSAMWGANCVDRSHTYANIFSIVSGTYSGLEILRTPQWSFYAGFSGGPPQGSPPDPHPGCDKNLIINYNCSDTFSGYAYIPPEANNHWSPVMDCTNRYYGSWGTINVTSANYGTASHYIPVMNPVNGVRSHCQGFYTCNGFVEYKLWGDPAVGSDKKLWGTYTCSLDPNQTVHSFLVSAEANHKPYTLSCL